ncbi:MAG TPA: hypothetical protein VEV44_17140 [Pseudoneobacillus sp.]|nr:hypothetical protein [Pseudoneobacillus sp.]
MGRSRKPFMDKTTNLFLKLDNKQIVDLLDSMNIDYDIPELAFDSEVLNKLSDEIRNILEDYLKNCKK